MNTVINRFEKVTVKGQYGWGRFQVPINAKIVQVGSSANINALSFSFTDDRSFITAPYARSVVYNPPLAVQEGMNVYVQSSQANQDIYIMYELPDDE